MRVIPVGDITGRLPWEAAVPKRIKSRYSADRRPGSLSFLLNRKPLAGLVTPLSPVDSAGCVDPRNSESAANRNSQLSQGHAPSRDPSTMAGLSHLFLGSTPFSPPFQRFSFFLHPHLPFSPLFLPLSHSSKVLTAISLLSLFYFQSFSVHIRSVSLLDTLFIPVSPFCLTYARHEAYQHCRWCDSLCQHRSG